MNSDDKILEEPEATVQTAEDRQENTDAGTAEVTSPVVEEVVAEDTVEAVPEMVEEPEDTASSVEPEDEEPEDSALLAEPTDEELFLAALNGDLPTTAEDDFLFTPLTRGQIVKGTVASVSDSEILVDVGTKSEGIISGRERESLDSDTVSALKTGEEIFVYVLTPEDRHGHTQLSLRRALEEQDWREAEEYMESTEAYRSNVAGFNKGGLIVPFGKVRGFVPASQISQDRRRRSIGATPDERWAEMIGEDIVVKVIEVDRRRNRLILSERAASREQRAERRAELLESLEVGQIHVGRVISLADFGAFVDLGGADGLIHLSELSWKHINHPQEVLKVGDEVEVEIINIDRERQRIGLSRKNRLDDPWTTLSDRYHPGQLVQGTVTKMTKFGAFARLVDHPEIEGLIHISELSEHRVKHPREVVEEGEVVTLRILRIEPDKRRLGLSLKRVDSEEYMNEDWHDLVESIDEEPGGAAAEPEMVEVVEAEAEEATEPEMAEVVEVEAEETAEPEMAEVVEAEAEETAEPEMVEVVEAEAEVDEDARAVDEDESAEAAE
jgi:small subunit ribosomal protein S1